MVSFFHQWRMVLPLTSCTSVLVPESVFDDDDDDTVAAVVVVGDDGGGMMFIMYCLAGIRGATINMNTPNALFSVTSDRADVVAAPTRADSIPHIAIAAAAL